MDYNHKSLLAAPIFGPPTADPNTWSTSPLTGPEPGGDDRTQFPGPGVQGSPVFLTIARVGRAVLFDKKSLYSQILLLKVSTFYLWALRGILRLYSRPQIHQELHCMPPTQQISFSGPLKCSEPLKTCIHQLNVPSQNCIRSLWALLCP